MSRGAFMKRREFLAALGASALLCPRPASAVERVIGVLVGSEKTTAVLQRLEVLRNALSRLGWTEGREIKFEYRFEPDGKRLPERATELVAAGCAVILTNSTLETLAAMTATKTIPIVFFAAADPIGSRIVQSLAKPGGNVTGATNFEPSLGSKWIDLLRHVAPSTARIAVLTNTENPGERGMRIAVEDAASQKKLSVVTVAAQQKEDLKTSLEAFGETPNGGLIILPGNATGIASALIVDLAAKLGLAAVYPWRHFVDDGGLLSYGVDLMEGVVRAASHADKILRGAAPADLPVEGPTKFLLVLNLKTANRLGLTVPQTMLVAADEVIE